MININSFRSSAPVEENKKKERPSQIVIPNGVIVTSEASYATLDKLYFLHMTGKVSLGDEELCLLKEWMAIQYQSGNFERRNR